MNTVMTLWFIKDEGFLGQHSDYQLLKKVSASWNQLYCDEAVADNTEAVCCALASRRDGISKRSVEC
jgi:hypothetical protein